MRFSEYACPLNGCRNRTSDPRRPCGDCVAAFGDLIRPSSARVSAEEFARESAAGDAQVRRVLAERWLTERDRALQQEKAGHWQAARRARFETDRAVYLAKAEAEALAAARQGLLAPIQRPERRPRFTDEELAEEVVHLVWWCGLSGEEAAGRLGVSKARVEAALRGVRETAA